MGKGKGVSDDVFATHEAYYDASSLWDAMIIENVPEYPPSIPLGRLGPGWAAQHCILDPRIFGIPASRSRFYMIAYRT